MGNFFRNILLAPLNVIGAVRAVPEDFDYDALERIIDARQARAERGVLRDYCAQNDITGEDVSLVEAEYRRRRQAALPDENTVAELRKRCAESERRLSEVKLSGAVEKEMAHLGMDEGCREDVLLLVRSRLPDGHTDDDIKKAVADVAVRFGGMSAHSGTGNAGNFPRKNDAGMVMQQQLNALRASGDNAAAVALISAAAERGMNLR